MNAINELLIVLMDAISLTESKQLKMILKENARSIHEIIAQLHLAAESEASPKAIDQVLADKVSSYFDGAPNNFRSIILGKVVGHR